MEWILGVKVGHREATPLFLVRNYNIRNYNSLNLGADSVNEQLETSSREMLKVNPMALLMYYLWKMREKVIRRVAPGFPSGRSDHTLRIHQGARGPIKGSVLHKVM